MQRENRGGDPGPRRAASNSVLELLLSACYVDSVEDREQQVGEFLGALGAFSKEVIHIVSL